MAEWVDRYWNSPDDGLKLHYRDYAGPADRPPLLCLPGLTRNARDFEPIADRFAGEWRVIAVDFRGRGLSQSDPRPERYLPPTYARDLLKLLDQLGIADAVFVGTSLGGLVTMLIAATDEERIAGAVINDIGPEIDTAGLERIRSYVGKPLRWSGWDEAAAALRAQQGALFPMMPDDAWLPYARKLYRAESNGSIVPDYDLAVAAPFDADNGRPPPDLWPLLGGLKGKPVLIVRGALSDLFSAAVADRMVREIGSAELVTIPDTGHTPLLDEPEALAAIDRLLSRIAG